MLDRFEIEMLLDAEHALFETAENHPVADDRVVIVGDRLPQPGDVGREFRAQPSDLGGKLIEPAAMLGYPLRHFGEELIDRPDVWSVAFAHRLDRIIPLLALRL